ncbi:hypothetical protein JCM10449v2_000787 [Rhodotorula kratochvilovae]
MDSIGQLSSSLPPDWEDKQLQASFRQAALSITALFKQGKKATTKAYIGGQRQALQEVLEFLQALLDQPSAQPSTSSAPLASGPVDVGRLINFICARQEALKAEEEDHDEDDPSPGPPPAAPPVRRSASAAPTPVSPLRPSVAFARSNSSSGVPPRAASAAPTTTASSSRLHRDPTTSSAPASPPSSTFSPPYIRPSASTHQAQHPPQRSLFGPSSSASSSAPFAAPASPSPLSSQQQAAAFLSGPASPLGPGTGSRARALRPSRGGSTRGSKPPSGAATPVAASAGGVSVGMGMGEEYGFEVGMKRRWLPGAASGAAGTQAGAEEVVELPHPSVGAGGTSGGMDEGMDVEGMMEGWDGVGERPLKRVARRGAGPGEGEEGQAQR